ncbi:unnamed protein product [Durusdinium trenchii]|uniref:Uncharacterized protein n=1 Tax=Durusdinium trenchii TaxID=1381693 RepID=A0ABP0NXY9_9DINO
MANSSQSEPDCWTTVGWAACSRACFEKAKQAVMYNGPRRLGLTHFSSSPMGAVWEFRKTAVRSLGGTLSSSVLPRKKALRSSSTAEKMEVALNDPNFVIFQLVTKDNIPALLGRKVLSYQPDGSYVFAAGQCPFLPDAAFTDYFKLKVRHCTIQPSICGEWAAKQEVKVQGPRSKLFKYYIAIDDLLNENSLEEADVAPLLWLLGQNATSTDHPFSPEGEIVYPLCSSSQQAMALGFFAYKRTNLKLVEIAYPGLIGSKAPIAHPMGASWLLGLDMLSELREAKKVELRFAPYEVCKNDVTKGFLTSADLYQDCQRVSLRKRKLALVAEVAEMKSQLQEKESELDQIQASLKDSSVRKELPKAFPPAKQMHKCAPLSIAADVKMADSVGFKELACIYEATGNALWLQTGAFAASPRDNINWASLEAFTEKFFSKRVAFKSTVTRSLSASKKQKGEKKRLIWPSVMISIVDNMKAALVESPDAGIPLIPTGQFVLWSWFLALHNAIKAADKEHLDLLWEAGLTVTLQVRFCAGDKEKCLARNLQSEAIKALGHASLSDSFVTFAVAVKTMGIDKVQAGVDLCLAYNGTVYNAAIHKASLLLASVLEDSSRAVESALFALELQYGRDILSSEYSKLSKLIAHSKSMACSWSRVHGPTSPYEFVAWLLRMLVLAFQTKLRPPAKATEQWLDKDRKTGLPGFWQAAAVVLQVFEYADKLLARLPEADADKAAKVLDELLDPCSCWDKFLRPGDKSSLPDCFHEDDVEDEEGVVIVPAGPMASVKESFNKATGMLFDLLLELVSGKRLADCQHIAAQPAGLVKALAEVQGEHADDAVELLKQLHLITTLFEGHATKSVSASTDAFLASFRGCGKVFAHGGVLNTSHRLFVASADLLVEQGEEPWAMASVPPQALWKEMVGFMAATASGPADFIMAFDGRMREVRRWSVP